MGRTQSLHSPVARILAPPPAAHAATPLAGGRWRKCCSFSPSHLLLSKVLKLGQKKKKPGECASATICVRRRKAERTPVGRSHEFVRSGMEFGEEASPASALEKDALELTVEDVYDISYVIGRDLLKIRGRGEEVSDLQFKIVRVLEMFESLVTKRSLAAEELKMERDNLRTELDRVLGERSSGRDTVGVRASYARPGTHH